MSHPQRGFFAAMQASERRAVGVVSVIAIFRMFGLFALLPVLAVFARDLDGATPLLIGIAVGGYGLTQALLQIPAGALSDRIGRVPVILGGLAVFAAGSVLAALSDDIWGVVLGRLLQGAGAISATLTAMLADATRAEIRTRTMALLGVSIGASFLLALILGPLLAAAFGPRSLFWLAAGLAAAAAAVLVLAPGDFHAGKRGPREPLSAAFRPDLLRLDLFVFLLHAMLTASFVALPIMLGERAGMPLASQWQVYVGALLLSLAGAVPLIIADDRRGKAWTLAAAVALLLCGQGILWATAGSIVFAVAGLAVFFAGFNALEASLPARLSLAASENLRGASLGVFSSCQFAGAFAGGLLGGVLLGSGDVATVFAVCAGLALAWLLLVMLAPAAPKPAETA